MPKLSPVATSVPFDNTTFQLENSPNNVQDAIENLVKPFNSPVLALSGESTIVSNTTKTLSRTSNSIQIFTGTVSGQILKFPNATTLSVGHVFDIWNLSSQNLTIRNFSDTLLTTLKPNANTKAILIDNTTSAGTWALSYTLDNGNVFGTQAFYEEALSETSTNSTTTFLNKVTLNCTGLPLGDYLVQWQFIWRASNANRTLDVRIQRNASNIINWQPFTANLADRQLISGFRRVTSISGNQTFTLDFKVSGTSTTVFMQQAALLVWRIA